MANEEQVALVARGSKVWGIWRGENPQTEIDLRRAYLVNANLFHADFSSASLREANLYGACLRGADLREANLYGACLRGADLREANLYGACLRDADLRDADLTNADLTNADLTNADLTDAVLIDAEIAGANLSDAELYGACYGSKKPPKAELENPNCSQEQMKLLGQGRDAWNDWRRKNISEKIVLEGANLTGVNLQGFDLREASLSGAKLTEAILNNAELSRANLSRTNLEDADLVCTDFRDANLSDAHLEKAKMYQTCFKRAILCDANLRYAWMDGVDFSGADLRKINLYEISSGARGGSLDFSDADLSNASMNRADLGASNFSGANLHGAFLYEADLGMADFSNSNLSNAHLYEANLEKAKLIHANLSHADLRSVRLLGANLSSSNLTGACIENWHIGESTVLNDIICCYIFRTCNDRLIEFSGRLPMDPEIEFAPGEFTKRFQIISSAVETIDLTFTKGIDWQAFFESFQELQFDLPEADISIQRMERKGEAFVIRMETESRADKGAIETKVKQLYLAKLKAIEARYREKFQLQGAHLIDIRNLLQHERRENTRLNKAVEMLALGQQSLNDDAREIRSLLITLAETHNTTTDAGKAKLMKKLSQEVQQHPKWRRALKEGGIELIKVLCAPIGVPLEIARIYLEED